MTASTSRVCAILSVALLGTGCRLGLPPEPPAEDPVNAEAPIPAWEPSASVFDRSAFDDAHEPLGESQHGHAGHGVDRSAFDDEPLDESQHGHAGHAGHSGANAPVAPPEAESPRNRDTVHGGHHR